MSNRIALVVTVVIICGFLVLPWLARPVALDAAATLAQPQLALSAGLEPSSDTRGLEPTSEATSPEPASSPTVSEPVSLAPDLGLRNLPLLSEQTVAQMDDADIRQLTGLTRATASTLGLDYDALIIEAGADGNEFMSGGSLTLHEGFPDTAAATVAFVSEALQGEVDETALLDLSGLLLITGAIYQDYSEIAAYALLRHASDAAPTCDVQLALGHLLSLAEWGYGAQPELEKAVTLCPNDPTPLWVLGNLELALAPETFPALETHDLRPNALAAFQRLKQNFPQSPLGPLGMADAEMATAEGFGENLRPFAALAGWKRADDHISAAATLTSSPYVASGRARALCGIGDCDQAADMMDKVSDKSFDDLRAHLNVRAGRFTQASTYEEPALVVRPGQMLTASMTWLPGAHGFFATAAHSASTAWFPGLIIKGGERGGSTVSQDSYLPTHRINTSALSGSGARHVGLFLTDRHDELATECEQEEWPSRACRAVGAVTATDIESSAFEAAQDLLRLGERFGDAEDITREWESNSFSPLAQDRLGEILHLQGDTKGALEAFDAALMRSGETMVDDWDYAVLGDDEPDRWDTWLRSLHLLSESDFGAAMSEYKATEWLLGSPEEAVSDEAYYFANLRIGTLLLERAEPEQALPALARAHQSSLLYEHLDSGAAAHNAALAAIEVGEYETAKGYAEHAVSVDEDNPIFQEALGEALRKLGVSAESAPTTIAPSASESMPKGDDPDEEKEGTSTPDGPATQASAPLDQDEPSAGCGSMDDAIGRYRTALQLDDTLFSTWNNLGLLLADCDMQDAARAAFAQAVQVRPDYPLGWFNFGASMLNGSPGDLLAAEGALGIAFKMRPELREEEPVLLWDEQTYQSGLDLSKPIPVEWKLGNNTREGVPPIALLLVVVVAIRIIVSLWTDQVTDTVTRRMVSSRDRATGKFRRVLSATLPGWIGTVVSIIVLMLLLDWIAPMERWFLLPAVVALVCMPWVLQRLASVDASTEIPILMVVASAALASVGLPMTPLNGGRVRQQWALLLPIVMVVVVLATAATSFATRVPAAGLLLVAATSLLGTVVLPFRPYAGYFLSRPVGWIITGITGAVAVLAAVGWA